MTADRILRLALSTSVALNTLGVVVFGSAALGKPVMAMPVAIAPFYAAQLALIIGLFGAVYGWLARQPVVDRPLLLVGAIGKIGFFLLFVAYFMRGDLPLGSVLQASPDVLLGGVFVWWLRQPTGIRERG